MSYDKWLWRRRNVRLQRQYKATYRLNPNSYGRWQDVRDEVEHMSAFLQSVDDQGIWVPPHRRSRRHAFRQRDREQWAQSKWDQCLVCLKGAEASAHRGTRKKR